MDKREQGFGHVVAILAVVVVLAIGLAGWRVWSAAKNKQTTNESTANTANTANNATTGKKTYTDPVGKFTVEYPEAWTLQSQVDDEDPDFSSATATLTSSSGTVLQLNSDWGGKGGYCQPEPGDTPFAKNNACPTWEFLSSEETSINNVYYPEEKRKEDGTLEYAYDKTADIKLVTVHFGNPTGNDQYLIGLTDSRPEAPIKLNSPEMGLYPNYMWFTVYDSNGKFRPYIYAYAVGDSEAFLTSADAMAIKEILRTLRVDI